MKKTLLFFLALFLFASSHASKIKLDSDVSHVTVYHSGALVKRISSIELPPGLHELSLTNVSGKLVLNSLKVTNQEVTILNKTLLKKLTNEQFNQLIDKKDALEKQQSLIESKYSEVGFISKVEDLEKMTSFYLNKTLSIKKQLREINRQIENAKRLEEIQLENENAAILNILVSIEKKLISPLNIQYVCGGIGWSPSYSINVKNASETSLDLKYMARVMSQTGENWQNVKVSLSSSFPLESPTILPTPKTPWVLKPGSFELNNSNATIPQLDHESQEKIDQLEGVKYQEINIPFYLSLRDLDGEFSIKSNSTVFTFPILSTSLPANFFYYGFPSLDPQTFLVSEITGWNALELVDGVANITYNGNDVGKTILKFSESEETLLLPIARDNSVFLQRNEIVDQNYFKQSNSGKKKKAHRHFSLALKTTTPSPVKFELVDQIPISQSKSAEVEVKDLSSGNLNSSNGEVTWLLDLQPQQAMEKELIFSIEIDSAYSYSVRGYQKTRFKTISCPSF